MDKIKQKKELLEKLLEVFSGLFLESKRNLFMDVLKRVQNRNSDVQRWVKQLDENHGKILQNVFNSKSFCFRTWSFYFYFNENLDLSSLIPWSSLFECCSNILSRFHDFVWASGAYLVWKTKICRIFLNNFAFKSFPTRIGKFSLRVLFSSSGSKYVKVVMKYFPNTSEFYNERFEAYWITSLKTVQSTVQINKHH